MGFVLLSFLSIRLVYPSAMSSGYTKISTHPEEEVEGNENRLCLDFENVEGFVVKPGHRSDG